MNEIFSDIIEDREQKILSVLPKFKVAKNIIIDALSFCYAIVERKNPRPILANVMFKAGDQGLEITATDGEIAYKEIVPAVIENEGSFTVPAATLYEIIKKMPQDSVISFDKDKAAEGRVSICCENVDFVLPYISAEEFPDIKLGESKNKFKISSNELKFLIEKVRFAMLNDISRQYLTGIYFHAEGDCLLAVATDGHRLSKAAITLPENCEFLTQGIILPRKTILELYKIIESFESEVTVELSETKILFYFNNAFLLSKLIDGRFPKYQNVIPKNIDNIVEVNVKNLKSAVDRIDTVTDEKTHAIKFIASKDKLELSTTADAQNKGCEILSAVSESNEIETVFNSRYVLDILSVIDAENVKIAFGGDKIASIFCDLNYEDVIHIIMPMRL